MPITAPSTVGTYNFQWRMNTPDGMPFGSVSPATNVQVIAAGPANYEGLWWNSPAESESGWGINLAHQGDTIVATWGLSLIATQGTLIVVGSTMAGVGTPFGSFQVGHYSYSIYRLVLFGSSILSKTRGLQAPRRSKRD